MRKTIYEKSQSKLIECICPRCKSHHTTRIFWSGDTIPRKYCRRCKTEIREIDNECAVCTCTIYDSPDFMII